MSILVASVCLLSERFVRQRFRRSKAALALRLWESWYKRFRKPKPYSVAAVFALLDVDHRCAGAIVVRQSDPVVVASCLVSAEHSRRIIPSCFVWEWLRSGLEVASKCCALQQ